VNRVAPSIPPVVRTLLGGAIDYAGLFPPAALGMNEALGRYLAYRASPDAWALGRFVVPALRLDELAAAMPHSPPAGGPLVPLSALIGTGTADDVNLIERFNLDCSRIGARVDSVEVKAESEHVVRAVLGVIPPRWVRYVEVALDDGLPASLDAVERGGGFAKVRTGGTTPEAIPTPERLIGFLEETARRKLACKATAGLHHPVRGLHRLTEAPDTAWAVMYGYLNVLIAASILWRGGDRALAREALLESELGAFTINGDALLWHDLRFDGDALTLMRDGFFHGFGSCSFTEPLEELPAWAGR
jgi:hypothetical protein